MKQSQKEKKTENEANKEVAVKKKEDKKGYISVIRIQLYRDINIYIRKIGNLFEYLFARKGEVYSNYIKIKTTKKLSKKDINYASGLIFAAAIATVDSILKLEEEGKNEKISK